MKFLRNLFGRSSTKDRGQVGNETDDQNKYSGSISDLMLNEGSTYGEAVAKATGGANLVDGKQTWEHAADSKDDIDIMKRCCAAEIETDKKTGDFPAPFYFWRVAILSSKQKNYQQEVEYLQAYVDIVRRRYSRNDMSLDEAIQNRVLSARVCDIFERLPKAKERLAKQKAAR